MNKIDPNTKYPDLHTAVWVYHMVSDGQVKVVSLGYWTGVRWCHLNVSDKSALPDSIKNVVGWTELTPPKF